MSEIRVKSTGTIKLFESDNTSSVTIASPASLGGDRTITIPDADVNLTNIAVNTAKTSNATHSGEVTGATALTIADNIVDEANLKVSNSATNGYFLSAQSGNSGGLTWAVPTAGWNLLETQTASNVSHITMYNSITSTYDTYKFVLNHVISANDIAAIRMSARASYTSQQGYAALSAFKVNTSGTITTTTGAPSGTAISFGYYLSNTATEAGFNAEITLYNPLPNTSTLAIIKSGQEDSSGLFVNESGVIKWNQAAIDNVIFDMASGNITSGTFSIYGLRK